jgi:hypothetical protein
MFTNIFEILNRIDENPLAIIEINWAAETSLASYLILK